MFNYFLKAIVELLVDIPIILLIFLVFENAKGWMALYLGDNTSKKYDQLSINPFKYIDTFGFLFFVIFGFGWSKSITIDSRKLKKRFSRYLVSVAGFAGNISLIALIILLLKIYTPTEKNYFYSFFRKGILLNINFLIINLIPIPPFEGSRIIENYHPEYHRLEPIGIFIFFIVFVTKIGYYLKLISNKIFEVLI